MKASGCDRRLLAAACVSASKATSGRDQPVTEGCSRPVADPQTYGKLTLNVELAGAARLHRAASVLMDGLELSGAHI